jgi:hypothetical protein
MKYTLVNFEEEEGQHWTDQEKKTTEAAVLDVAQAYADSYNNFMSNLYSSIGDIGSPRSIGPVEAFLKIHDTAVTFLRKALTAAQALGGGSDAWGYTFSAQTIWVFSNATSQDVINNPRWAIHELGHAFENATIIVRPNGTSYKPGRASLPSKLLGSRLGFHGGWLDWQYSKEMSDGEIFADMFIGWVYKRWEGNQGQQLTFQVGLARSSHMHQGMPIWINMAMNH